MAQSAKGIWSISARYACCRNRHTFTLLARRQVRRYACSVKIVENLENQRFSTFRRLQRAKTRKTTLYVSFARFCCDRAQQRLARLRHRCFVHIQQIAEILATLAFRTICCKRAKTRKTTLYVSFARFCCDRAQQRLARLRHRCFVHIQQIAEIPLRPLSGRSR